MEVEPATSGRHRIMATASRLQRSAVGRGILGRWSLGSLFTGLVAIAGISASPPVDANQAAAAMLAAQLGSQVHAAPAVARSRLEIAPELLQELQTGKPKELAIYFARPDLSRAAQMDWKARGRYVYETLKAESDRLQAPLRQQMQTQGYSFKSFWIDNVVIVDNADVALVNSLTQLEGVERVIELAEQQLFLPDPSGKPEPPLAMHVSDKTNNPIPNLIRVKAPQAWGLGATGLGSVVGIIDQGPRHSHEALRNAYRGHLGGGTYDHNYNYLNPYGLGTIGAPGDHGTHTTGTAVGSTPTQTIGMAPDAKWIGCRGCATTSCGGAELLQCAQFMAAPTTLTFTNPDPDLRPHVVNNSWGSCQQTYDSWYQGVVNSWIAAGIVPVFSNGNASNCGYSAPPGLNTVGNPARYGNVLGIGSSSNSTGTYATHSNWGPTDNPSPGLPNAPDHFGFPSIKPNVIAPGVSILSSTSGSDTAYQSSGWTGTSMSAPHVAGLVAQMISAAPCLEGDYPTLGSIIMETAVPVPYNSGGSPAPGPGNVPNYATGWGEIDAEAAVIAAVGLCGDRGTIAGVVTDSGTSAPISGVAVNIINPAPPPPNYNVLTAADGSYSRDVGITEGADRYTVHFSRYGYLPMTVNDVEVDTDEITTVDVALDPAPMFAVSGTVVDGVTGWPLHARIDINGFPDGPVWTDPVTGAYSVNLAAGIEYSFSVNANAPGYDALSRDVGPLAAPQTEDFDLGANLATCAAPGYSFSNFFTEDFEANDGGFTLSGPAPAPWQWGTPTVFPNACASGAGCWGTNLSGNYNNSANQTITSPVIDLTGVTGDLQVAWKQAYRIETHSWDKAFAEYSIDGGTWVEMWRNPSSTPPAPGVDWEERTATIAGFSGSNLQVRFRFTSDTSVVYTGWYIDDLAVRELGSACAPVAGAYVVGTVSDANTHAPINGALVTPSSGVASTSATSADPAQGAGFYSSWVAAGNQTLEASFPLYGHAPVNVTVVDAVNQRVDLQLGTGELSVVPSSLSQSVELGDSVTTQLAVINTGTAPATVSLAAIGSMPEHFETSFPPDGWSVFNEPGVTAGCGWRRNDQWGLPNHAGGDGTAAAVNADGCGTGTTTHSSLITPPLDFSANSSVSISYVVAYRHLGSSRLHLETSTDGGGTWTTVHSYSADLSPSGPGAPQSFDLTTQLAGAANARIRFRYQGGFDWWALVDQIDIRSDVPWLSIDPNAGTFVTPQGAAQLLSDVTFDASQVSAPGVYTTQIFVEHNTPNPVPPVPVTMTVTAPASFGQLVGRVTGLGHCGLDPADLEGASVVVTSSSGTYPLSTNGDGEYALFLDASEGPLDIVVSAAGHQGAEAEGVPLVASDVTTQDFDLDALLGCSSAADTPIDVTLSPGGTSTVTVQLDNAGLGAASFGTSEAPAQLRLVVDMGQGETRAATGTLRSSAQGTHVQQRELVAMPMGSSISVGILSPDTLRPNNLATLLNAFPEISATVIPLASLPSISAATLAPFDVVLLSNNNQWQPAGGVSASQVGNALADYVDAGGRVIAAHYVHDFDLWAMGGRFITGGYSPFTTSTLDRPTATYTLGTVLEPGHPLMNGISALSVSGGAALQNVGMRAGATEIARWNNNDPLIGVNADGTVVAINALVGDLSTGFSWTGQFAELIRNAAMFLSVPPFDAEWLSVSPASGMVPAEGSANVSVDFEAVSGLGAGTYHARVLIALDDGGGNTSTVDIPVSLTVEIVLESDLALTVEASPDPALTGQPVSYLVTLANAGPDPVDDAVLAISLPSNATFTGIAGSGWSCDEVAGALNCAPASTLAVDGSTSFTLNFVAGTPGTISFNATASSAASNDPDTSDNSVDVETTVVAPPKEDEIFSSGFEGSL